MVDGVGGELEDDIAQIASRCAGARREVDDGAAAKAKKAEPARRVRHHRREPRHRTPRAPPPSPLLPRSPPRTLATMAMDVVTRFWISCNLCCFACMVAGSILYLRFLFPAMRTLFGYN